MGTAYPIGASFSRRTSSAEFDLGQCGLGDDGSEYVYIKATSSAFSAFDVVAFNASGKGSRLTKALADAGRRIGVPQADFAASEFGWVCIRNGGDEVEVKVAANAAPNVRLYTTSTPGTLDDTSASQSAVFGITIEQTAGASAGGGNGLTIRARIEYPHTQATA